MPMSMSIVIDRGLENPFLSDPDLRIDRAHEEMGFFTEQLSLDVWRDKYRWGDEQDLADTAERVVRGIYHNDSVEYAQEAYHAITAGLWMPAGRILAGAGTPKRVTLMNCYVNATVQDSMESIMQCLSFAALTMQQGGGIGTDFSTIRPEGAILKRTGTQASGPLPFMDMWHAMCTTIRSAGDRRGAMMGTISDTHPDLPKFIVAKQTPNRLTNFNISVLISDAFMDAVKEDEDWVLYFHEPPLERDNSLQEYDFEDDDGRKQYVYSVWRARDLWELITRNTYEYSEPGVIFIDRINAINNLHYCETIRCTNPCGEQPLPPHGTCNLGAVNLARMVRNPFKDNASFNWELLKHIVRIGVRFLDNVIEQTNYPLEEQRAEEFAKRRLGLGFTGLADALAQLKLRYGNPKSADIAERIMRTICETAYETSIELAKERGPFPLFNAQGYLDSNTFAATRLSDGLKDEIRKHGIRNGLLLTVAPTGTTSIVFGNPASGIEPIFAHYVTRQVRQKNDDVWKPYKEWGYSARLYRHIYGEDAEFPSYMVTTEDLTVDDHIAIQSRMQRWVDASISKTINIPQEASYEEFVRVYDLAYNSGCKGCTTYRPSDVRGAILSTGTETSDKTSEKEGLPARPEVLHGTTYKIKWPRRNAALYLTINSDETGKPFEVFFASKDASHLEWMTLASLLITAIFRKGGDISFVPVELQQIQSLHDGAWIGKRYWGSLPAYIGHLLEQHLTGSHTALAPQTVVVDDESKLERCVQCKAPAVIREAGCKKCTNCGYSECG